MYNDEKLLSLEEYEKLARAYAEELKKHSFLFFPLNEQNEKMHAQKVAQILQMIKSSLFSLGGFLGTGKLYNLTEKHIEKINFWFPSLPKAQNFKVLHDKTRCFLNLIALENELIYFLIELAKSSFHAVEIFEIIKERTSLSSSLYQINGVISY